MENLFMLTTMSKQKVKISEKQEVALRQTKANKLVKLNGITVNTSTIDSIMPLNEYYRLNPNERPASNTYKQIETPKKEPMTQSRRIRQLESMIRGFKKTNDGKTGNGRVILQRMNKSLELAKQGEKIEVQPSKMFGY